MSRETESQIDTQREFYETSQTKSIDEYFKGGIYKVAIDHARHDMVPQIDIIQMSDVDSLEKAASLLATVEDTNENFKGIDPSTDQGKYDLAVETKARELAQAEQINDPKVKSKFLETVDKGVDKIIDSIGRVTSKVGGKKAIMALSGVAFGLAACGPNVIVPGVVDGGGGGGTPTTEVLPTAIPTEISPDSINIDAGIVFEPKDGRAISVEKYGGPTSLISAVRAEFNKETGVKDENAQVASFTINTSENKKAYVFLMLDNGGTRVANVADDTFYVAFKDGEKLDLITDSNWQKGSFKFFKLTPMRALNNLPTYSIVGSNGESTPVVVNDHGQTKYVLFTENGEKLALEKDSTAALIALHLNSDTIPSIINVEKALTATEILNGSWEGLQFIKNGTYFEAKDEQGNLIKDIKFFDDGTAKLEYKGNSLIIAFQSITRKEGKFIAGLWEYKNSEWTMETYAAPKTEQETEGWRSLTIIIGHKKEKEMIDTVFKARDIALTKSETYDPADEFKNITVVVNGETINNFDVRPKYWIHVNNKVMTPGNVYFDPISSNSRVIYAFNSPAYSARPIQISLENWFKLNIIASQDTNEGFVAFHIPVVAMDSNGSLKKLSALLVSEELSKVEHLLTREERGKLWPWLLSQDVSPQWGIANRTLVSFVVRTNSSYFSIPSHTPAMEVAFPRAPLPNGIDKLFFTLFANPIDL